MISKKRTLVIALSLALVVMLFVVLVTSLAKNAPTGELLQNGGFESGFASVGGCGAVGSGWGCFTSGGRNGFGFYDEGWAAVVAGGQHAQLIEINTKKDAAEPNGTAGIYQTIHVVKGQTYQLKFKALMRADDLAAGGDPWRYVVLVGVSQDGNTDWSKASWQEVNAGPIQNRTSPSGYYDVQVPIQAAGNTLTVFIAGRMKWGDWNREVDFDFDNVSLMGPLPGKGQWPSHPGHSKPAPVPESHPMHPVHPVHPVQPPVAQPQPQLVCDGPNLLANGNFEGGFDAYGTAKYWAAYNNGGAANYGYYDDTWAPVVAEGKHAQLLEINSKGMSSTQPDRLIGVYQRLWWLEKGATYQFSAKSMIREDAAHPDEDANRYEVYWGYRAGDWPIATPSDLSGWWGMPVSGISVRTSPGSYSSYSTTFTMPSEKLVLYLFGLKKWATAEREVNFDFDDVQLRKCRWTGDGVTPPPPPPPPQACTYVVKRGDTLSRIAKHHHTTVKWLAKANGIKNPSLIYPKQVLSVPCKPPKGK